MFLLHGAQPTYLTEAVFFVANIPIVEQKKFAFYFCLFVLYCFFPLTLGPDIFLMPLETFSISSKNALHCTFTDDLPN